VKWILIDGTCKRPFVALLYFKQYNEELMRMRMAHKSASQFTYHVLAEKGAKFDDKASKFLFTNGNNEITLRNWSNSYNMFDNWILLNLMMALSLITN
jgi:hypothetical protein